LLTADLKLSGTHSLGQQPKYSKALMFSFIQVIISHPDSFGKQIVGSAQTETNIFVFLSITGS